MLDGEVGLPDELVGEEAGLVVVVSCSVVVGDLVVSATATEGESVAGRLVVVSDKEEAVDGSFAAVFAATVEDSIDGRLVVGFVTEEASMLGEWVVGWEGTKIVSVVFSIGVED